MPVTQFIRDQGVTREDVQAVAAYISYVAGHCHDVFGRNIIPSQSPALVGLLKDSARLLELSHHRHFSPALSKAILDLRAHVGGDCFDEFSENKYMGKSIHLFHLSSKLEIVIDKIVRFHFSGQEVDEAEAEWIDETITVPLYTMGRRS